MKLKIKVKELTEGCMPIIKKYGEWIDLMSATHINLDAPQADTLKRKKSGEQEVCYRNVDIPYCMVPLGVAMKLPEGYEAQIISRSSNPKMRGLMSVIGTGLIDSTYQGNDDEWFFICSPLRTTFIEKGERVCQFRIVLSQKATVWQKIKWLFTSGVELVKVDNLEAPNRGGIGSTGK